MYYKGRIWLGTSISMTRNQRMSRPLEDQDRAVKRPRVEHGSISELFLYAAPVTKIENVSRTSYRITYKNQQPTLKLSCYRVRCRSTATFSSVHSWIRQIDLSTAAAMWKYSWISFFLVPLAICVVSPGIRYLTMAEVIMTALMRYWRWVVAIWSSVVLFTCFTPQFSFVFKSMPFLLLLRASPLKTLRTMSKKSEASMLNLKKQSLGARERLAEYQSKPYAGESQLRQHGWACGAVLAKRFGCDSYTFYCKLPYSGAIR